MLTVPCHPSYAQIATRKLLHSNCWHLNGIHRDQSVTATETKLQLLRENTNDSTRKLSVVETDDFTGGYITERKVTVKSRKNDFFFVSFPLLLSQLLSHLCLLLLVPRLKYLFSNYVPENGNSPRKRMRHRKLKVVADKEMDILMKASVTLSGGLLCTGAHLHSRRSPENPRKENASCKIIAVRKNCLHF